MSGHSKWSTIKRQKGVADAKRGQVFTKISKAISVAAKEGGGGDPGTNFRLRLAVEQAKAVNMPKENIERAIERGLRKGAGANQIESVTYEAFGPGKIAILVEVATDNRNRTGADIKGIVERSGGNFASPGAVSWMFIEEGTITLSKNGKLFEEIFEVAVEAGAQNVEDEGDLVMVYTKPNGLESVKGALVVKGLVIQSAELAKKPTNMVEISDEQIARQVLSFMEKIEEHDDVQKVWSNFEIPDEVLKTTQE